MAEADTARLTLRRFTLADAREVFDAVTPEVTRWMSWDPPPWHAYEARAAATAEADPTSEMHLVIRRRDNGQCLGMASAERLEGDLPELGIWLRLDAHGLGYGGEAVAALLGWASTASAARGFLWPAAVENTASRRIAERLGGRIIAARTTPKYEAVVYRIPARRS